MVSSASGSMDGMVVVHDELRVPSAVYTIDTSVSSTMISLEDAQGMQSRSESRMNADRA